MVTHLQLFIISIIITDWGFLNCLPEAVELLSYKGVQPSNCGRSCENSSFICYYFGALLVVGGKKQT